MPIFNTNSYTRIAGQATTVLKAGSGVLHSITISSGTAATATINVFDNTAGSGTVIFSYTQGAAAPTAPVTLIFDARFNTGLTIVTGAANPDITVTYA
jgi:large exoprotein involved in heme utilization and adhesion